jgi:hypothetical protein
VIHLWCDGARIRASPREEQTDYRFGCPRLNLTDLKNIIPLSKFDSVAHGISYKSAFIEVPKKH